MVKRICVLFPDGSLNVISGVTARTVQVNQARTEVRCFNKGEKDDLKKAQFGEIEIDLVGFREMF